MQLVAGIPQQVPIAGVGHPVSAGKVAAMDMTGTIRFADRVDSEQDFDCFPPIRSISGSVKQPHVEFDMRLVVFGQILTGWCAVLKRVDHGLAPYCGPDCSSRTHLSEIAPDEEQQMTSADDDASRFSVFASTIDK
ncbi:hypothetical protein [Paenirhodobacter populi]